MKLVIMMFIVGILTTMARSIEEQDDQLPLSGVMGKIKSSLQLATKMLGLDRVAGIAQLVTETFAGGKNSKKGETNDEPNQNLFSGFFRLLGLDAGKLGAIAINGFIFLAQLISTSLKLEPNQKITYARSVDSELPIAWFEKNKKLHRVIENAKNRNLPDKIIEYIQEQTSDEESSCIELLVCKSKPLIWGMQTTISNSLKNVSVLNLKGSEPMFATLPTLEEVMENGDKCEENYPHCQFLQ